MSSVERMEPVPLDLLPSQPRPGGNAALMLLDTAARMTAASGKMLLLSKLLPKLRSEGRKVLILGNHDYETPNVVHPVIESLGWERPPVQQLEVTDGGQRVFLSHFACRTWPGIRKGSGHFYGHSHGELPNYYRSRDVGVDCPDTRYSPRTFSELTRQMKGAGVPEGAV